MMVSKELQLRSNGVCELCGSSNEISSYAVSPYAGNYAEECVVVCETCSSQLADPSLVDINHWRCLNDCMWSEVSAVKVLAYRMLDQLKHEGWPADLLEVIYLTDEELTWAKTGMDSGDGVVHLDSNGTRLATGDTVVLIKDLEVKGANFTAKRGTAVRNIRLVHDNPEQLEGKVNGQSIVILTQYVKK
jgi:protein PhnA